MGLDNNIFVFIICEHQYNLMGVVPIFIHQHFHSLYWNDLPRELDLKKTLSSIASIKLLGRFSIYGSAMSEEMR